MTDTTEGEDGSSSADTARDGSSDDTTTDTTSSNDTSPDDTGEDDGGNNSTEDGGSDSSMDGGSDGGPDGASDTSSEGDPCQYDGSSEGVCGEATIGPDGSCQEPANYEQDESSCDDKDNDCDGAVDEGCPCAYQGSSQGVCGSSTIGSNGNCQEPANYQNSESDCRDQIDNDCDGQTDCQDSNCRSSPNCQDPDCSRTESVCGDGQDNDCDGRTDCQDSDCAQKSCGVGPQTCCNNVCQPAPQCP